MTDLIMEEVYEARRHLWERGGGTMHGVCEYLRKRHAERMARKAAADAPHGQTTKRPNGDSDSARKGNEGE